MGAFVTYLAPEGDDSHVSWLGYTFADGEPLQVSNDLLIEKARGNRFFDVEDVAEVSEAVEVLEKRKPGRPRKVVAAPVPEPVADQAQAEAVPVEADNAEVGA